MAACDILLVAEKCREMSPVRVGSIVVEQCASGVRFGTVHIGTVHGNHRPGEVERADIRDLYTALGSFIAQAAGLGPSYTEHLAERHFDIYDLQRLMVERVKAAGFAVRRVVWRPGESLGIAFFVSDNHTARISFDEEMVIPLALNRQSLIDWMDHAIASHRQA